MFIVRSPFLMLISAVLSLSYVSLLFFFPFDVLLMLVLFLADFFFVVRRRFCVSPRVAFLFSADPPLFLWCVKFFFFVLLALLYFVRLMSFDVHNCCCFWRICGSSIRSPFPLLRAFLCFVGLGRGRPCLRLDLSLLKIELLVGLIGVLLLALDSVSPPRLSGLVITPSRPSLVHLVFSISPLL